MIESPVSSSPDAKQLRPSRELGNQQSRGQAQRSSPQASELATMMAMAMTLMFVACATDAAIMLQQAASESGCTGISRGCEATTICKRFMYRYSISGKHRGGVPTRRENKCVLTDLYTYIVFLALSNSSRISQSWRQE